MELKPFQIHQMLYTKEKWGAKKPMVEEDIKKTIGQVNEDYLFGL